MINSVPMNPPKTSNNSRSLSSPGARSMYVGNAMANGTREFYAEIMQGAEARDHNTGEIISSSAGPRRDAPIAAASCSSASGMVAQYLFSTCFSAGLLIGFGKKKSMPESMHSFTLLSSANAVSATMGQLYPISRIKRVDCRPSRLGIWTSMKMRLNRLDCCMLSLTSSKASWPSLATVTSVGCLLAAFKSGNLEDRDNAYRRCLRA